MHAFVALRPTIDAEKTIWDACNPQLVNTPIGHFQEFYMQCKVNNVPLFDDLGLNCPRDNYSFIAKFLNKDFNVPPGFFFAGTNYAQLETTGGMRAHDDTSRRRAVEDSESPVTPSVAMLQPPYAGAVDPAHPLTVSRTTCVPTALTSKNPLWYLPLHLFKGLIPTRRGFQLHIKCKNAIKSLTSKCLRPLTTGPISHNPEAAPTTDKYLPTNHTWVKADELTKITVQLITMENRMWTFDVANQDVKIFEMPATANNGDIYIHDLPPFDT
jgi:hypothetical protein